MASIRSVTGELSQLATATEMLRILECPVCNEVPFPPIFQCVKGHSICKKCKPRIAKCPLCQCQFSETRNYMVEEIILTSMHACCYKEYGCKVVEKGESIQKHMENCKYRPGKCPLYSMDGCSVTFLKLDEVKQHLITMHAPCKIYSLAEACKTVPLSISEALGSRASKWFGCAVILEFDGKDFLLNLTRKDAMFSWVVLLLGTQAEEKEQKYQIGIDLQSDKGLKLSWDIPIQSVRNRTVDSYAYEEPEIFKPVVRWEDMKRIGVVDKVTEKYNFNVTYTIY